MSDARAPSGRPERSGSATEDDEATPDVHLSPDAPAEDRLALASGHVAAATCWCMPHLTFTDPVTDGRVFTHTRPN